MTAQAKMPGSMMGGEEATKPVESSFQEAILQNPQVQQTVMQTLPPLPAEAPPLQRKEAERLHKFCLSTIFDNNWESFQKTYNQLYPENTDDQAREAYKKLIEAIHGARADDLGQKANQEKKAGNQEAAERHLVEASRSSSILADVVGKTEEEKQKIKQERDERTLEIVGDGLTEQQREDMLGAALTAGFATAAVMQMRMNWGMETPEEVGPMDAETVSDIAAEANEEVADAKFNEAVRDANRERARDLEERVKVSPSIEDAVQSEEFRRLSDAVGARAAKQAAEGLKAGESLDVVLAEMAKQAILHGKLHTHPPNLAGVAPKVTQAE